MRCIGSKVQVIHSVIPCASTASRWANFRARPMPRCRYSGITAIIWLQCFGESWPRWSVPYPGQLSTNPTMPPVSLGPSRANAPRRTPPFLVIVISIWAGTKSMSLDSHTRCCRNCTCWHSTGDCSTRISTPLMWPLALFIALVPPQKCGLWPSLLRPVLRMVSGPRQSALPVPA